MPPDIAKHAFPKESAEPWHASRLVMLCCGLLIAIAIFLRFFMLHRMPGINGDETYGVLIMRDLLGGRPFPWIMPDGHVISLLWTAVHGAWLLLLPDSFATLRLPVALTSTLLLFGCSLLFYRSLGLRRALAATMLMACLPVMIAFSRISWEMSLVVPATTFTLLCAWQGRIIAATVSFLLGMLIHPVMIFALPASAPLLVWHVWSREGWSWRQRAFIFGGGGGLAVLVALSLLWSLPTMYHQMGPMFERLTRFAELREYLGLSLQLFSGISIYGDFSGVPADRVIAWHDGLCGVIFGLVVFLGALLFIKRRRARELALLIGTLLLVGALYFAGGSAHLVAGLERHGLPLVAPIVLLFICALDEISSLLGRPALTLWLTVVLSSLSLTSFGIFYFGEYFTRGGDATKVYRTAPVEPKAAAFEWIVRDSRERHHSSAAHDTTAPAVEQITVIAEDWWNFWPLKFLAAQRPDGAVHLLDLQTVG